MNTTKAHHKKVTPLISLVSVTLAALLVVAVTAGCSSAAPQESSNDQASSGAQTPTVQEPAADETSPLITSLTPDEGLSFSLYFGLIDKTTGAQELTTAEYREAIAAIFIEAGVGYTVYEAFGAYPLEDGTVVENVTLVFTGVHGSEEAIQALIDTTQAELNLESVYCESYMRGYGISGGVVNSLE